MMPEGCYTNSKGLLKFKKGAFLPMAPIKIVCFDYNMYEGKRFNFTNIALRSIMGRIVSGLQFHKEWRIFEFDAFDPAKIGLTKEEDWEKFANKCQEIMEKVLKVKSYNLTFQDQKDYEGLSGFHWDW